MADIGVKTVREIGAGSIPKLSSPIDVGIVGVGLGTVQIITDLETKLSAGENDIDIFITDTAEDVLKVSANQTDYINTYTKNIDYNFTTPNKITWLNSLLQSPELEAVHGADGTNMDTTSVYEFKVTATGTPKTTGDAGETLGSNSITCKCTAITDSIILKWSKVQFATGYNIYLRINQTGSFLRIATIANPNTITYKLVTTPSAGSTEIPVQATAVRKPALNSSYYVTYSKLVYDTDIHVISSQSEAEQLFGYGSELSNMTQLALKTYNLSQVYACAVNSSKTDVTIDKFINAIDKLSNFKIQYICALTNSESVQSYAMVHAKNMSGIEEQNERFAVRSIVNTVHDVGTESTANTILYFLKSYNNEKRLIVPIPNRNQLVMTYYNEPDGTVTENKLVPNYMIACAYMFLIASQPDPATSTIGQQLYGFTYPVSSTSSYWIDSAVCDKIAKLGGTYIKNVNGIPIVYNDNTNDTSLIENWERSVLSGEDELVRRIRLFFVSYLGKKITVNNKILSSIYSHVNDLLVLAKTDEIISDYDTGSLEVKQNAINKTEVDVYFKYTPAYPLKQLIFKYTFSA